MSPLNPSPFSPGIHEYPLEPPRKMFWILMHGMATLIKLVSSATCSLFLKKIKIQGIDCMREIKLESILASFLKVGEADLVPKILSMILMW